MDKSWSQAGQDEWVHSIIGDSGYFVDVGAHDGIVHSNTYALEQRGWTGICIEPNRDAFNALCASGRSCYVWNAAASSASGHVEFDGVRVVGGATGTVTAWPLVTMLERSTVAAPDIIDYLSIDVEGHELDVLEGMDFARWHVRLITIEHNLYSDGPERKNAIYEYLSRRGFERVREDVVAEGYGEYEDWYRHSDD